MRLSLCACMVFSALTFSLSVAQERETRKDAPAREQKVQSDSTAFVPANDRERAMLRMIQELKREVASLRRQLDGQRRVAPEAGGARRTDRPVRDGDVRREGPRDTGRPRPESRRDTPVGQAPQNSRIFKQAQRIFAAYDKNKDGFASFEEWLKMREGEMTDQRRASEKRHFSEPAGEDGKITQEEFYRWMLSRQRGNAGREDGTRDAAERKPDSRERARQDRSDRPVDSTRGREGDRS